MNHLNTSSRSTSPRSTLHLRGSRARLPYCVEDARFASFALAQAYATFRAEESGHEVVIAKYGIVVEYVS